MTCTACISEGERVTCAVGACIISYYGLTCTIPSYVSAPLYPNLEEGHFLLELTAGFNSSSAETLAIRLGVADAHIESKKNEFKDSPNLLAYHLIKAWHDNTPLDNAGCCMELASALCEIGQAAFAKKVDPHFKS